MLERVFDVPALLVCIGAGVLLFLIRLIVGIVRSDDNAVVRGVEVGLTTLFGGFLAHTLVTIVLAIGHDSRGAVLATSWWFFLWPGAINTIPFLAGSDLPIGKDALLWLAVGIGSFVGMMDGLWRIHPWVGTGVLSFFLDVTWGLAGNVNASLLHLINFAWGEHSDEPRSGQHRYAKGFCVKSGFAFTQGNVSSSLPDAEGTSLYDHEHTHVWQNRAFGPLFILTYIGWMVVMFIPSLIAGAARSVGLGEAIEDWCYYDNPWETWAYLVGAGPRVGRSVLIWSDGLVLAIAIPFFLASLALGLLFALRVWLP
jgi:hypothetical protein